MNFWPVKAWTLRLHFPYRINQYHLERYAMHLVCTLAKDRWSAQSKPSSHHSGWQQRGPPSPKELDRSRLVNRRRR